HLPPRCLRTTNSDFAIGLCLSQGQRLMLTSPLVETQGITLDRKFDPWPRINSTVSESLGSKVPCPRSQLSTVNSRSIDFFE
ncbi:MAG: hypothetical protein ACRC62_09680, partial [Microcoleus sp.]